MTDPNAYIETHERAFEPSHKNDDKTYTPRDTRPDNREECDSRYDLADADLPDRGLRSRDPSPGPDIRNNKTYRMCALGDDCEICSGRLKDDLLPTESADCTRAVKNVNAKLAVDMLGCPAVGTCPVSLKAKIGKATGFELLPCGDVLFRFTSTKGNIMWLHELEVMEVGQTYQVDESDGDDDDGGSC